MVGLMLGVCSIMGLPWFVAATVLSITHVNSLKLESECSAPGEQPKFLGIREQRFTGLMIFVLMGSSVFMTSVLKVIFCLLVCFFNCKYIFRESEELKVQFCLPLVYSNACVVWSVPVHGCVVSQRHSGKTALCWIQCFCVFNWSNSKRVSLLLIWCLKDLPTHQLGSEWHLVCVVVSFIQMHSG